MSAASIPAPSTPCPDIRVIFRGEPVRPLPDIRVIFRGQVKQADHAWRRFRNSDFGQFFWDNDASTRSNLMGWGANAGMLIPGAGKVLGVGRALHWLGNTANRYRNARNLGQAGTAVARNVPRIGQATTTPVTTAGRTTLTSSRGQTVIPHNVGRTAIPATTPATMPAVVSQTAGAVAPPSLAGRMAGGLRNTASETLKALGGYQAGLASGAGLGSALEATGLSSGATNMIDDPGYWQRAGDLNALAYAPAIGVGTAAGVGARNLIPSRWSTLARGTGTIGAGLGAGGAADALTDAYVRPHLPRDRGHQAADHFTEHLGFNSTDSHTRDTFRQHLTDQHDLLEGRQRSAINRDILGSYRGIRGPNARFGPQTIPIPAEGGTEEWNSGDVARELAKGLGISIPQAPAPVPSQAVSPQVAFPQYVPSQAAPLQAAFPQAAQPQAAPSQDTVYNNTNSPQRFFITNPDTGFSAPLFAHEMRHVRQLEDGSKVWRTIRNGRFVDMPVHTR